MKEYHKIQTVWERDPDTKFKTLIRGKWACPEFEYLAQSNWVGTEKIDGTNIRVMWDGDKVTFGGKTDRASIPAALIERLQELFYAGAMANIFTGPACLYGEGFGAKIQNGGNYGAKQDFCLFDVRCGDVWLERKNVTDIAHKLECSEAPIINMGTLAELIHITEIGFNSRWGDFLAEGLVARPEVELLNRNGGRIITKIKTKDFR